MSISLHPEEIVRFEVTNKVYTGLPRVIISKEIDTYTNALTQISKDESKLTMRHRYL